MTNFELGLWSLPALLVLILLRAPVGLAMFICGAGGLWLATGSPAMLLARMKTETFSTFSSYSLSIIPMFLLMGQFATRGGMSEALFRAAGAFVGHRRGGLGIAAIGACAGFGAICGSSLATAATMGQVALPELRRAGWSGGLSTAIIAAGGTLGILIPPSVVLVLYAILTEQNIGKLFLAAFIPGILAALFYMAVIRLYLATRPSEGGRAARAPWQDRWRALAGVWPVLAVFLLVVFGIYDGWFTPTEGAAIGAAATGVIALVSGRLNWRGLGEALLRTAAGSAMVFFIILGAAVFNGFLALAQVPQTLSARVIASGLPPLAVLLLILAVYVLLGMVMDSMSMILLTVPIFFPVIMALDFGLTPEQTAIWFGILVLVVVEVGLISPPVGMNLFVLAAMAPDTPVAATYARVVWFVLADLIRVALLVAFPVIVLFAV
ncbi:MAG: TRAP transporter large permease [Paracoccus sp. (in: a-proteobacteria)]|uniref:TRAP transporter large permease n=1 Tax=Paracoccus sp. TaxID=267 RepID=UPI0026DF2B29|nr:TRAP transporter large permease [Paracoccus sp. (in: a-proteobacteria)]MDO5613831.1 TRAP transporter large permease [Paracoccus sp. (in: a-proteobacteria)]